MSTSVWRPIRGDLRRILLGVTGVPDIQYEARRIAPTTGVAWIGESIEKGNSRPVTLGRSGMVEEQGIYLLDLNWPSSSSFADGEDLADAIRLAFYPGRAIESSGADFIKGGVLASVARRAVPLPDWTIFPVRVEFFFRRATRQGFAA